MNRNKHLILINYSFLLAMFLTACQKDPQKDKDTPVATQTSNGSFTEEFDNAGDLTAKGWVFVNNSNPIGQNGWRQGRYEAQTTAKFPGTDPFIGFPAYSAHNSPNDFISCDAAAVNAQGTISAWLISPVVPMRDGDTLVFYTRAMDDSNFPVYLKDRMQVRLNLNDSTANVGKTESSVGSFTTTLIDINSAYVTNDPTGNTAGIPGYPRFWARARLRISGVPGGSVNKARFAFRYYGVDCGISGGVSGSNYPSVVGIDSLAFIHH